MKLNDNIVKLRKKRGLTQEQLADILNVSVTAVSKWENGNNRPDIELLPDMADIFQVSIDSLLGYEKAYKNLDKCLIEIESLLGCEQYEAAIIKLRDIVKSYPNDFRVNKLLADSYYSLIFSEEADREQNIDRAIVYYERSIELFEEKYNKISTIETLEIQIATAFMLKKDRIDDTIALIEKHNQNGKYDNLMAKCLFEAGKREEAKSIILKHCVSGQIFVFNDLTTLADMCEKEENYIDALAFLEGEVTLYKLFMNEDETGNYADRAYAGKAEIISGLYKKIHNMEKAKQWHMEAVEHAKRYVKNPSMQISSLKYCENVSGRMIDNYQELIKKLCEES